MPRNYCKKAKLYNADDISQALHEVRENHMSIREASKKFNLNFSFLYRKLKNLHQGVQGRRTALSQNDEEALASNIKIMAKWGFPLTKKEIGDVVHDYISANGIKTSFKDNRPGTDWFIAFCKRHRLSLKKPENLESVRRKATSDPFIIYNFYDILENEIKNLGLQDKPQQIFNLDETSFSFDPSRIKAVGVKGEKLHRNIQGSGRENITVLACVSASGFLLPPLFVFQANNLWTSWKGNNDLPNTFYSCSEKGWMTAPIFQEYFYKFCELIKERPILLIFDGHLTHLDVGTIEKAKSEKITIIKLPAHTTDSLQPLDKCCFRPLKLLWDKELITWQRENQRKLTKSEFVDILCKIWNSGMTSETIVSGFRSTGIYPPNRNRYPVSRLDPDKLQRYHEHVKTPVDHGDISTVRPSDLQQIGNDPEFSEQGALPAIINTPSTSSTALVVENIRDSPHIKDEKVTFESLLLAKVNKFPTPNNETRRKIDGRGKVITSEDFLNEIKAKNEYRSKKKKVAEKIKGRNHNIKINDNNADSLNTNTKEKRIAKARQDSSEESDESMEVATDSDLDDIDTIPPPDFIELLSVDPLNVGDFVLARFKGGKRSVHAYKYVCEVLNIYSLTEIEVVGLKSSDSTKKEFVKVTSDISFISNSDIIGKLPPPRNDDEKYIFSLPVEVYELQ